MDNQELLVKVREQMTEHRYQHTLGVVETAKILAKRFGADPKKAELAAILHDYAKYWTDEQLIRVIVERGLPQELLNYNKQLWHGPVAAEVVQELFHIKDEEVITAVRYHTSGRANMSLLEKIIWLADYIEPGRHFPGVEEVREIAGQDLNQALLKALDQTIVFLIKQGQKVYPLTLLARNHLLDEKEVLPIVE
ncbi:bis(5'-nucleosyl)-tetraphosphatase (symmetrical) YqeK [Microaerobacter geothermalis]|uniref:bis(5'-nucleosyl)-tetraphosphatase (symmetrical) YqeK n=1 Tax=Microaerobacter geothermalis TaxID=674972 RepID=UPI001F1BDDED|nr:bis(5'-nucleosyl)-tetraphosphatase (symmetrical) YqeK [Microaerobacter geothermalis]MCF6092904.1 bis(5'-nucleosyl)-tetraphosphatase (symmetrical) YqeK [Microaerobacter geothermalis]